MNRKFLEELLNVVEDDTKRKEIVDTLMAKNGELIESHKTEVATLKNDLKVKEGVVNNLNEKIKMNNYSKKMHDWKKCLSKME